MWTLVAGYSLDKGQLLSYYIAEKYYLSLCEHYMPVVPQGGVGLQGSSSICMKC